MQIHSLPRVLVVIGPTGVGKTDAAIRLALHLDTEIISADSMQVYRFMDIGTAKPSPEQLRMVKHHMVNIVDPSTPFSAGKYREAVIPIIERLHQRKRIPVIVGGTGLYIKAVTKGLFAAPDADPSLRKELLALEDEKKGVLYERLKELDPDAAERITPNDVRRIVRALEVQTKAQRTISELQRKLTIPLAGEFIKIGLTRERRELYGRIEDRVDRMFTAGLVQEVQRVMELHPCYTAMQAIGYKEVSRYLLGEQSLEETRALVKRESRRYAKRQYTWFRKEEGIHWVDITGIGDSGEINRRIIQTAQERIVDISST
ncbi:MAG: tRNA (adenosine(37)-N6)-dimethylallyltransferase MiaA [bacterium]